MSLVVGAKKVWQTSVLLTCALCSTIAHAQAETATAIVVVVESPSALPADVVRSALRDAAEEEFAMVSALDAESFQGTIVGTMVITIADDALRARVSFARVGVLSEQVEQVTRTTDADPTEWLCAAAMRTIEEAVRVEESQPAHSELITPWGQQAESSIQRVPHRELLDPWHQQARLREALVRRAAARNPRTIREVINPWANVRRQAREAGRTLSEPAPRRRRARSR